MHGVLQYHSTSVDKKNLVMSLLTFNTKPRVSAFLARLIAGKTLKHCRILQSKLFDVQRIIFLK